MQRPRLCMGDPFAPSHRRRYVIRPGLSSRSVSRMLNLGSRGIRFSILIIANSSAIDGFVGFRGPGRPHLQARQPGYYSFSLLLHSRSAAQPASRQHTSLYR